MSDNWVVQNLENALETWNEKLSEIWTLITTTPQNFKGGNIWKVIVDINGAVQAIGLALLVLFFVIGMVKTCGMENLFCMYHMMKMMECGNFYVEKHMKQTKQS